MANVSYDRTRQSRSAAGSARTTPGISGTTSNPNGSGTFASSPYSAAQAAGAPNDGTPHLSKAAGGKGAGTPNTPQWRTNSQNRFNQSQEYLRRRDRQRNQQGQQQQQRMFGQLNRNLAQEMRNSEADPNYVPSMMPQQYQYQYQNPGAGNVQYPSMQPQINQLNELSQMNMQMQSNPDAFSMWLQQQYGQGLLNGVADSNYKYRNDPRLQQTFG